VQIELFVREMPNLASAPKLTGRESGQLQMKEARCDSLESRPQ